MGCGELEGEGGLRSFEGRKGRKSYWLGGCGRWEVDLFGKVRKGKGGEGGGVEESEGYGEVVEREVIGRVGESY